MKEIIIFLSVVMMTIAGCDGPAEPFEFEKENETERIGAVYISCESPPWKFLLEDLFICEQESLPDTTLNPSNACPMSSIQRFVGDVHLNYSTEIDRGRFHVFSPGNLLSIRNENGVEVDTLYLNDNDKWSIVRGDTMMAMNVFNVYVGGCFHEMITWKYAD